MSDETENQNAEEAEAPEPEVLDDEIGAEAELGEDLEEEMDAGLLERRSNNRANRHQRAIFGVPVRVIVSVGSARPTIGELLNMKRDSLLPLDSKLEDPVDIMIGKRVVARGELQELEDGEGRLGVRLTEIVDLSEPF